MPQLNQIDTFPSQIFWLLVTFVALFVFLRFVALPRIASVLEARREQVEGDLDRAARLKKEADELLAAYQAAIADGRAQAQAVVRRASDEMKGQAQAAQSDLGARLAGQIKDAEANIDRARADAVANVQSASADAVRSIADRLIGLEVDAASASDAVKAAAAERA
jgi:F-type H+-transporting ATPase subunit b